MRSGTDISVADCGSGFQLSDLLIEKRRGDDAAVEVAQIQLFVRGVGILIRQADPKEHGGDAELLLEGGDNRDRAAFAVEHRWLAETAFDGASSRLHERVVEVGHPRFAAVHACQADLYGLWR